MIQLEINGLSGITGKLVPVNNIPMSMEKKKQIPEFSVSILFEGLS
jgi:hypothetical protein